MFVQICLKLWVSCSLVTLRKINWGRFYSLVTIQEEWKRTRHAQSETRSEGPRRKTGGCLLFFFREVFRIATSTSQACTEAQPLRHTNACTYRWRFSENSSRQLGTSICQLLPESCMFWGGQIVLDGQQGYWHASLFWFNLLLELKMM